MKCYIDNRLRIILFFMQTIDIKLFFYTYMKFTDSRKTGTVSKPIAKNMRCLFRDKYLNISWSI